MAHRFRLAISLLAGLALTGYILSPQRFDLARAQGSWLITPERNLSAAQLAAHARRAGSLRGLDLQAMVRRFSVESRLRAQQQAGAVGANAIVNANNWTLTPAGNQMTLGDLPVSETVAPDGRHLLIVNSGAGIQSIQIVDLTSSAIVQTLPYPSPHSVFVGAAYSPNGTHAYVAGGGENTIHTFSVDASGDLTPAGDIQESPAPAPFSQLSTSSYPTGLAVSRDGKSLFVANSNSNGVAIIDLSSQKVTNVVTGTDPYGTLVDPRTGLVYVTNWGDATVSVIDPSGPSVMSTIHVGDHPTAMTMGPTGMLYVADSNSDAVSVIDTTSKTEVNRISVVPGLSQPPGSSPQGLAVSPDGRRLYVADAGDNALSVFSLSFDGRAVMFQGWIPTAWYPTAVTVSGDGQKLFVANGFGMGEHANTGPLEPNPTLVTPDVPNIQQPSYCSCALDQFTGTMDAGTLSTISAPNEGVLRSDTLQVADNDHFFDLSRLDRSDGNPIPTPGGSSPIKHVIYIIKENRTYDQVFGDETAANGSASLALFPKAVTPNLHALAERFGILDNFYADAQVSADGHNWSLSANANDYVEKTWPQDYSSPGRNFGYPFEGGTRLPLSPGGYLWDAAAAAGISYRDYGLYANFPNTATAVIQAESAACSGPATHTYIGTPIPAGKVLCFDPMTINAGVSPNLAGHIDPQFMNYDMRFPDGERVAEWKREFTGFVANSNLPALEVMRLSSDHTKGTSPGYWTPQRYVSENDAAVGQVVDAVSHSSYWSSTAIFVVEDDAQNGPDHVDSHRTEALVISPYTSQASIRAESTHYDTSAMVRTIELILGLKPLSRYDATARPMWHLFGSQANAAPYSAIPQGVTTGTTSLRDFGARQSETLNFALPDQAAAGALNRILWHNIKGAKTPYPGPVPYGIPLSHPSHYIWGAMGKTVYPALGMTDTPAVHIQPAQHR